MSRRVHFGLRHAFNRYGNRRVISYQLCQIPVASYDQGLITSLIAESGQGTDNVVGFIVG